MLIAVGPAGRSTTIDMAVEGVRIPWGPPVVDIVDHYAYIENVDGSRGQSKLDIQ